MNFDDPRITAYALGELENPEDRSAVEALLREDPQAAAALEETRAVAQLLRGELSAIEGSPLTQQQREHVLAVAAGAEPGNGVPTNQDSRNILAGPWYRQRWIPTAIAATVILSTGIGLYWDAADQNPEQPPAPAAGILTAEAQRPAPAQEDAPAPMMSLETGQSKDQLALAPSQTPASPVPSAPEKGETIEATKQLWVDASNFYNAGRYDLAYKRSEQILKVNPGDIPARKMQEEINRKRDSHSIAGYNLTRSHLAWNLEKAWDRPVRRFAGTINVGRPAATSPRDSEVLESRSVGVQVEASNTESYDSITDNAFKAVKDEPLSTFSIDVDTASYANIRRFLTNNQRPPKGAVRIEEFVNYFPYSYTPPAAEAGEPFSTAMEVAPAPWAPQHRLVRIALKGREIAKEKLPPSNLVFLIDVSGSMHPGNKLPLVKESLLQLVRELREQDSVGIVVYAGSSGVVLEPTNNKEAIQEALGRLEAGGSTNGASGIQAAYDLAQRAFKKGGNNRVVLATDGDFNVGITSQSDLVELIERKAKTGVFLSVLGFGMGNTKDSTLEKLADKGNGNYAYVDSLREARKVLVEEMTGTLFTIAKDVKIQVEFNPTNVGAYRLIGYENRLLAKEDFNDDTKDAGEIGAGHAVTALYEIVPAGVASPVRSAVDPLKYQQTLTKIEPQTTRADKSKEMLTLKLRYKQPDSDTSVLKEIPLTDNHAQLQEASADLRFAAAVASFGMLLRDSPHRGNATWDSVATLARDAMGEDRGGYRAEFLSLVEQAKQIVPVTPITGAPESPVVTANKAAALILPEFDLNEQPVLDAIDALSKKSKEVDSERSGVAIVYAGPSSAAQKKITLQMRNISVLEAARMIASAAGLKIEQQGATIVLRAE